MPSFIIKATPDEDFYFTWSTVVDAPTVYGTRDQFLAAGEKPERLDRADETGSSSAGEVADWYTWEDAENFVLMNYEVPGVPGIREVRREDMRRYCEATTVDEVLACTEPFEFE